MVESGRILHHLEQSVARRQDCVLVVGYQGRGTLGRKLLDAHERVKIFGEDCSVRCNVTSKPGFSAYVGYQQLLGFTGCLHRSCRQVFVVHGEKRQAGYYASKLRDHGFKGVEEPAQGERFEVI